MNHTATLRHGFQPTTTGGTWNVWAPRAQCAELVLIQGAQREILSMQSVVPNWFQYEAAEVKPGQQYFFRLDKDQELPDPASRWQPKGVFGPSAVFASNSFQWTDDEWRGRPFRDLVIYELHVGTFTAEGTFAAIAARLPDLKQLGINCIELMPVAQFSGSRNWGYDGVFPCAVQNTYGSPADLQRLVDECHHHGISVLLDVVFNHLGPEGNYFAPYGPYFTDKYRTPWGQAWNYDGPQSDNVRGFVLDAVTYLLREFHLDGLRLDAVHGIYDQSGTHILAEIQQLANSEIEAARRHIHIVAESDLNDVRLLNPPEYGGYGLVAQWSDDFHHSVHALLTGERHGYYGDFGCPEQLVKAVRQAFVYDGCYSSFRQRRHGAPTGGHSGDRFVVSIQNHDQVGNRAIGDRLSHQLNLDQQKLAAGLMLLSANVPLLFMGEEYGERAPFPFFCSFADESLIEAVRQGRRAEFVGFNWPESIPDPQNEETMRSAVLTWNWSVESWQGELRNWYHDLILARQLLKPLQDHQLVDAHWHGVDSLSQLPDEVAADYRQSRREADLGGVNPTKYQPDGVLEFIRTCRLTNERMRALFNMSVRPALIPDASEELMATELFPLLSSASRRYGGSRLDVSLLAGESSPVIRALRPFEVLIFATGTCQVSWHERRL